MDDLSVIEDWLEPLLQKFTPSERKKLNRELSKGLRRRQSVRIRKQQSPDGSNYEQRRPRKEGGKIKKRAQLFQQLRKIRHMKLAPSADKAEVGFKGRSAHLVRIHQEGMLARVAPNGPLYKYPIRKVLGLSTADREWLLEELQNHLKV